MTGRLSIAALESLPAAVRKPAYDVTRIEPGIVHLGAGAFFRAHLAVYTDDLLGCNSGDWGITAVSMRRPAVAEALNLQQGLYTVTDYGPGGEHSVRVIGSIHDALVLADSPAEVIHAMSRPGTRVVSLTVTEKAYYRAAGSAGLDMDSSLVRADLEAVQPCGTAVGALVAGLAARRECGAGPLTVVCCDNLPENGSMLRGLCHDFAAAWMPGLNGWIEDHVSFPSTMVDRITPATTSELVESAAAALGCIDEVPIACESFRQWVIEDDFAGERPQWDLGGARFVSDVRPFEVMKLRLLNASHSALAYLGLLAGKEYVADAATTPELRQFIKSTMARELAPTVKGIAAAELSDYQQALLRRFSNPRPAHQLGQIAEDGSQKIPIRVLEPLREQLHRGGPIDRLVLIVAAWLVFLDRKADGRIAGPLRDPLSVRLLASCTATRASVRVQEFVDVFGAELLSSRRFLERLDYWCERLEKVPPASLMRSIAAGAPA